MLQYLCYQAPVVRNTLDHLVVHVGAALSDVRAVWWVECGALIGALREPSHRIPWDHDVELVVDLRNSSVHEMVVKSPPPAPAFTGVLNAHQTATRADWVRGVLLHAPGGPYCVDVVGEGGKLPMRVFVCGWAESYIEMSFADDRRGVPDSELFPLSPCKVGDADAWCPRDPAASLLGHDLCNVGHARSLDAVLSRRVLTHDKLGIPSTTLVAVCRLCGEDVDSYSGPLV